jgi:hypothetical protein
LKIEGRIVDFGCLYINPYNRGSLIVACLWMLFPNYLAIIERSISALLAQLLETEDILDVKWIRG